MSIITMWMVREITSIRKQQKVPEDATQFRYIIPIQEAVAVGEDVMGHSFTIPIRTAVIRKEAIPVPVLPISNTIPMTVVPATTGMVMDMDVTVLQRTIVEVIVIYPADVEAVSWDIP